MGLKAAANFFARTPLYGWTGTDFVELDVKGSLQPYDRFISEREFGLKRRMLLVNPDTPIPDDYTVIRVGTSGPAYLLGRVNEDWSVDNSYSLVYLLCIAPVVGELIELTRTAKASGMAFGTLDNSLGLWHCDIERLTFSNSTEFTQNRVSEVLVTLPSNCPANADHEFEVGGKRYVLQEVYPTAGFVQARSQVKNA